MYMKLPLRAGRDLRNGSCSRGGAAYLQYKLGILDHAQLDARDMMVQLQGGAGVGPGEGGRPGLQRAGGRRALRRGRAPGARAPGGGARGRHGVGSYEASSWSPLAERLGIEHILYTRLEVEDGRVHRARRRAHLLWRGQDLLAPASWWRSRTSISPAAGSTATPSPIVRSSTSSGHPVAVNPDPLLYREAARRSLARPLLHAARPATPHGVAVGSLTRGSVTPARRAAVPRSPLAGVPADHVLEVGFRLAAAE